jgi:hypothetical protein
VDGDQLREAVTQRLAAGDFRLIITVDQITLELRLVMEYLNGYTVAGVQVLALNYTKDGDVELLVPAAYGQEAAAAKPPAPPGPSPGPASRGTVKLFIVFSCSGALPTRA